jgi:hypothetical protein
MAYQFAKNKTMKHQNKIQIYFIFIGFLYFIGV